MDTCFQTLDEQIEVVQNQLFELRYEKDDWSQAFLIFYDSIALFWTIMFLSLPNSICEDK